MSRPREERGLRARPVHSERLPGRWDPPALQGGHGVTVQGELLGVSRHLILDVTGGKERYYVLYIRPSQVHRRKFDATGNEREPNFSNTRKVNTGFLMSSFKVEAKGDTDRLSPEELKGLVNKPELLSVTERHTPSQAVAFWLLETELEKMELELGTEIRLKTRGDSPFIWLTCQLGTPLGPHSAPLAPFSLSVSLARLHAGTVTKCNFVGDGQAGASWTDNILANKPPGGPAPEPRGRGDGAEEDEWDD
ncbi:arpin-like isoform 1-T1 [Pangshura tecta]